MVEVKKTTDIRGKPDAKLPQVVSRQFPRVGHSKLGTELTEKLNRSNGLRPELRGELRQKRFGRIKQNDLVFHWMSISHLVYEDKLQGRESPNPVAHARLSAQCAQWVTAGDSVYPVIRLSVAMGNCDDYDSFKTHDIGDEIREHRAVHSSVSTFTHTPQGGIFRNTMDNMLNFGSETNTEPRFL